MVFSVKLENKQRIIIEMNQHDGENILNKNDLYAFSVIVELSHKNMRTYPKVILINIDNFNIFQTDKPMLTFKIRDGFKTDLIMKYVDLSLEQIEQLKKDI